jgi:hypothetical protein
VNSKWLTTNIYSKQTFANTSSWNKLEPFALLLHDHGFGGNYDKFGRGGLMDSIAIHAQIKPTYLLVDYNTRPWRDYTKLEDVAGDHGGMHDMAQYLHKRN